MTRFEIFSRAFAHSYDSIANRLCMLDSCVSFLEIVFPTKLLEHQLRFQSRACALAFQRLADVCNLCHADVNLLLPFSFQERVVRLIGLEPMTPRLSSACSNQLSYSRVDFQERAVARVATSRFRGVDLRSLFDLLLHRKEVIQPQVPLRLPCYDFIPVTSLALGPCLLAVGS